MESKLIHDAERKAIETVVDHILSVKDPDERKGSLLRLSYLMEKFFRGFFAKSSFAGARDLIRQGGKMVEIRGTGTGHAQSPYPENRDHGSGF